MDGPLAVWPCSVLRSVCHEMKRAVHPAGAFDTCASAVVPLIAES